MLSMDNLRMLKTFKTSRRTHRLSYPYAGTIDFEICTDKTKLKLDLYRGATHNTNIRLQELLKLQLRVIGISDIEGMKPKVHLLD